MSGPKLRTDFDGQYRMRPRSDSAGTVYAMRFDSLSYFLLIVSPFFSPVQFFTFSVLRVP
jgi:hypothetical protein